jgi:hypothetical protein
MNPPTSSRSFPEMPNPTPADLADKTFQALWSQIKDWDINVPQFYEGYCGGNGSHVKLLLDALENHGVRQP